jgi:hypothetical protein
MTSSTNPSRVHDLTYKWAFLEITSSVSTSYQRLMDADLKSYSGVISLMFLKIPSFLLATASALVGALIGGMLYTCTNILPLAAAAVVRFPVLAGLYELSDKRESQLTEDDVFSFFDTMEFVASEEDDLFTPTNKYVRGLLNTVLGFLNSKTFWLSALKLGVAVAVIAAVGLSGPVIPGLAAAHALFGGFVSWMFGGITGSLLIVMQATAALCLSGLVSGAVSLGTSAALKRCFGNSSPEQAQGVSEPLPTTNDGGNSAPTLSETRSGFFYGGDSQPLTADQPQQPVQDTTGHQALPGWS